MCSSANHATHSNSSAHAGSAYERTLIDPAHGVPGKVFGEHLGRTIIDLAPGGQCQPVGAIGDAQLVAGIAYVVDYDFAALMDLPRSRVPAGGI